MSDILAHVLLSTNLVKSPPAMLSNQLCLWYVTSSYLYQTRIEFDMKGIQRCYSLNFPYLFFKSPKIYQCHKYDVVLYTVSILRSIILMVSICVISSQEKLFVAETSLYTKYPFFRTLLMWDGKE